MALLNEKMELAEIAYQGENYADSYEKYSEIVEEDINNKKAWIGKGLSAGRKSNPKDNTLKEAKICLKKAKEIGLSENEKKHVADEIIEIAEDFINKTNQSVVDVLVEKDKKPMATGELYAVRRVGQVVDRMKAFNNHWEYFEKAIGFSKYSLEFNEGVKSYKGILNNIDLILNESKQHFHHEHNTELKNLRKETLDSIKKYEPEFNAAPPKSDSDGCFIATAAYGSYNSAIVFELREFRDLYLKRNLFGRKFIQFYYFTSPPIAKFIKDNSFLKVITRKVIEITLLKIVRLLIK
jgi:hypothetical protein